MSAKLYLLGDIHIKPSSGCFGLKNTDTHTRQFNKKQKKNPSRSETRIHKEVTTGRSAHLSHSVTILAGVYMSTTLTNAAERGGGGGGEVKNRRISPFLLMKESVLVQRGLSERERL